MSSDGSAAAVLRSVAAVGLDAGPGDWPPQPLAEDEWRGVVQGAVREGVVGLLAAAVETGQLPASPQQCDDVRNTHTAVLHTCLRLEDHLLAVTGILAAADVDVRVLKGPAVAHLDYQDPSQRTFVDIDLLVRSEEFDRAVRALVVAGGTRRFQEIRRGFDRRFGKGACVVSPDRLETDIHRTFVMGPYGLWIDLDELWTAAEPFDVGGRELLALPADLRLLHACYHAALGDSTPRLSQLRDVAQMLIGADVPVNLQRLRSRARAWRGEAVVARAVSLTWDRLDLSDHALAAWAAGHRVSRRDVRALATYLDPDMGFAARSMMAVQAVPSLRGKAAFVRALALPSRSYGAGRHRDRRVRWRAALGELRRLIGRS